MAPSKIEPRVHKRVLSDQQRRRDLALQRQQECRRNLQLHARRLAAGLSSGGEENEGGDEDVVEAEEFEESYEVEGEGGGGESSSTKEDLKDLGLRQGTRLKGAKAREWFSKQLMLPEWMIDIPPRLKTDWYVMSRPAGVRCVVVSSNGTTVSRQRNGRVLHHFPSALPNGARTRDVSCASSVFCILDCIFHEPDKTYYVLDLMCWRGYSLYDCNTEFRFFWMNSKLAETDALKPASQYHRYRFSVLPVYECDVGGLQAAYSAPVPFTRDGIIFINRHAHYVLGSTPLSLLWKDSICSEYPVDTDSKGNVPQYQQVVLVLGDDGSLATSDDPPVVLGTMPRQFLEQHDQHLKPGTCLRFNVGDQGLRIVDGKPLFADIHFQGGAGRNKIADTSNKILYQYAARRDPLTISNLVAAVESTDDEGDFSMTG
ncbi:snurportin-1 [Marchantia polymorpha subsp. ruderalis]|uniref:Snurportin-1 n=2 Tax=Marchantia polymorpha TaxID=3197 RepID=A0AAF6B3N5_MARPO|nr:hypothetical protein MARPO_0024s0037 [Marchantia polymorpha]BBN06619.1 hypothetical protein Mp_3g22590 [Marchantia polymorpha subsp. ruderalis]|eukprot:PTQ43519.1 hypothetical protein MARPO_0024s0037 [Marchantia polymorpha]